MSSKSSLAERRAEMARKKAALQERKAKLAKLKEAKLKKRTAETGALGKATRVDSILEELKSQPAVAPAPAAASGAAGGAAGGVASASAASLAEKRALLTQVSGVAEVHLAGRQVESYSKGSQTVEVEGPEAEEGGSGADGAAPSSTAAAPPTPATSAASAVGADGAAAEEEGAPPPPPPPMSASEIRAAMSSEGFGSFLSSSSRVVERLLGQSETYGDVHVDYAGADSSEKTEEDVVALVETLFDERWSAQRPVTDVAWSPNHAELMLTSYFSRDGRRGWDGAAAAAGTDAEGTVLVWSVGMRKAPEYIFTAQSPVLAASFHRFSPHLVVGAGYSGQLFVWDMRAAKKSPVQRTPLCAAGHTHPVYSMAIVGSSHVHNITSVSTDGRLCIWDVAALHAPQEVVELKDVARADYRKKDSGDVEGGDIAVTCMAVS